ncbi:MAG TPA: SGNH/GDSL hydrolase family protein [Herpetosiphonaceae bacterium]
MRRFLIPSLILLTVLLSGGWYWARTQAAARSYTPTGPGEVYLALGDSLAAGFIVEQPQEAYVARIAAALQARQPIEVRNLAIPGETSASLLRRQLPQALAFIREQRAAGKRVSPITLDIGGNDARAVQSASDEARRRMIATIEANIGTTLDQLIAATSTRLGGRTADIAIMTYYNPFPGDPADQTTPAYWSAQLNGAITRAATARGVAVADVDRAFAGGSVYRYTYIAAGDVHANAAGHAVIAERFLQALQYREGDG